MDNLIILDLVELKSDGMIPGPNSGGLLISYLGFERFDPPRSERPSCQSEVSEFDMPSTIDQKVLEKMLNGA